MHEIPISFERLSEIPASELLGNIGVYVLWDSNATKCPSYIGEGHILQRLLDHRGKFAMPIDGYVAITGDSKRRYHKANAQVVELLLLAISERIGMPPKQNKKSGSLTSLIKRFGRSKKPRKNSGIMDFFICADRVSSHRKLKVHLKKGFDPFDHPAEANRQKTTWTIEVSRREERFFLSHHPWKNRETAEWRKSSYAL